MYKHITDSIASKANATVTSSIADIAKATYTVTKEVAGHDRTATVHVPSSSHLNQHHDQLVSHVVSEASTQFNAFRSKKKPKEVEAPAEVPAPADVQNLNV